MTASGAAIVGLMGVLVVMPGAGGLPVDRLSGTGGENDAVRWELVQGAMDRISHRPILGEMYTPDATTARVLSGNLERIYRSHAQYLDYALRGGMAAAIIFVVLQLMNIQFGRYVLRRYAATIEGRFAAAALGVTVASLVGNGFALLHVQSWTGFLLWWMCGTVCRLRDEGRHTALAMT